MMTLYLSSCQELLPATGVPIRPQRFDHNQEFSDYVRSRTLQNWKFWIVSLRELPAILFTLEWGFTVIYILCR